MKETTPVPAIVLVTTTVDDEERAVDMARGSIELRVAACAQVGGPIQSIYRWRGNIEDTREWTVTFKTTTTRYPALERYLRQAHPYEVPEIVGSIAATVTPEYASWVQAEVSVPVNEP
jgi:periplasmic divalent cation tolerance protein